MHIQPISELLSEKNLEYPALALLQPNEELYTALLVQPKAEIQVRDDFIRNSDRMAAQSTFFEIARVAHAKSVELLVTPEYSFPWETIEKLFQDGVTPGAGHLWILGCESLAIAELPGLKDRFAQWAIVLHEELSPNQPATARYLNPVVYMFRTRTMDSHVPSLVMVVQFKTCPSGDPHNTEATRMAKGRNVYLFERGNEVRLMTIICSDAFAFSDDLVKEHYENLLLLHIQLNEKPRNEDYMRFRRKLFAFDCDRTELICLNWAENIVFDLQDGAPTVTKKNISASSWHSKSNKFATDDSHIEHNHGYGVYYARDDEQKRHMLQFTYKPTAFFLQATKVRHHGVEAARSRRRGPELTKICHWDNSTSSWIDAEHPFDDGFVELTAAHGGQAIALNAVHATSPLAVERLACITNGDFGPMPNWYAVTHLHTMQLVSRADVMHRISVTIDPDGSGFRDQYIRTIKAIASISPAKLPLPSRLTDLHDGYRFEWCVDLPHSNVISNSSNQRATLVYAGESPLGDHLQGLHAQALATTYPSHQSDRLCVLYREGEDIKCYAPPNSRSITQTSSRPGKDFTEPAK